MKFNRMFPTLTLAATACAFGVAPVATAGAATDVQQASSENWSGYVVGDADQSSHFKTVTGSWVQPAASCSSSSSNTYAAFWVGLGGADGKTALEQDGTEVNCSATGQASYYAWYELVPKAPVKVDLAVHPGDHMTATTTVDGSSVTETIANTTTGQTFSKTLTMSNPDTTSAEWVAEAPSECQGGTASNCTALPLTDFKRVTFTNASATDSSGHTGSISDSAWQTDALTLTPGATSMGGAAGGYVGDYAQASSSSGAATPSNLSSNGSSFTVTYRKETSDEVSSSGGSGDGYGYSSSGDPYGYGSSGYGYGSGDGYGYGYGDGDGASSGDGYGSTGGYGYGYGNGGYIVVYTY